MLAKFNALRLKGESLTLTLVRVTLGVIMAVHGWQKYADFEGTLAFFGGRLGLPAPEFQVWAAIAGEFLGGLGLIFGAVTPIAAFGVVSTMSVAVFVVHWKNGLLASNRGFEYPLTLLTLGLFFMARGGGPYSLDELVLKKHFGPGRRILPAPSAADVDAAAAAEADSDAG